MRARLAIDDDVLLAAQERARQEGRPPGRVLSDLARQTLTERHQQRASEASDASNHGSQPLPRRGPAVSNALVDRLRDDQPRW